MHTHSLMLTNLKISKIWIISTQVSHMSEVAAGNLGQKCQQPLSSQLPGSEVTVSRVGRGVSIVGGESLGEAGMCSVDEVPWSHHRKATPDHEIVIGVAAHGSERSQHPWAENTEAGGLP